MNRTIITKSAYLLAGTVIFSASTVAQLMISAGDIYSQNFNTSGSSADDTLISSAGTGVPVAWSWTNNSTFEGWFRQVRINDSTTDSTAKDYIGEFQANTVRFGSMGNGGSFGDNIENPFTDRALGSLVNASGNEVAFGVVFQVSGADITGLNVSYTGEQWFRANASTLEFQYKVLGSFTAGSFLINDETGWSDLNALDFASPASGSNLKRNGNFADLRETLSGSIDLLATDGQYIAIRWRQAGSGTEAALAVDDLSVTAVPEPATFALLAGIGTLGIVFYRRRRTNR